MLLSLAFALNVGHEAWVLKVKVKNLAHKYLGLKVFKATMLSFVTNDEYGHN